MLLDPTATVVAEATDDVRPEHISAPLTRARKRHIRPESMLTEELADLMRGFDADTVARFIDFQKR